jgi:hypothetical protein
MLKPKKSGIALYDRRNYFLLILSVVLIAAGYVCLGTKPKDGIATMMVAPALLVLGYCVLLPVAVFLKPRQAALPEKKEESKPSAK